MDVLLVFLAVAVAGTELSLGAGAWAYPNAISEPQRGPLLGLEGGGDRCTLALQGGWGLTSPLVELHAPITHPDLYPILGESLVRVRTEALLRFFPILASSNIGRLRAGAHAGAGLLRTEDRIRPPYLPEATGFDVQWHVSSLFGLSADWAHSSGVGLRLAVDRTSWVESWGENTVVETRNHWQLLVTWAPALGAE